MTRGILRTDIDEDACADRLEQLYRDECALPQAQRGKYSLVPGQNGGNNPHAPGPWSISSDGRKRSDCIGTAVWARGFDRFQPIRFAHIYGGYINTDSILLDALGDRAVTGRGSARVPQKMFRVATVPRRGKFVVYSGRYDANGHKVPNSWGHIMTIVDVDPRIVEAPPNLIDIARGLVVVHCHGGATGRNVQAIARETLSAAIGTAASRARLIEMVP